MQMTGDAAVLEAATDGDVRSRILSAAARLIVMGGAQAATTRAVATAASVQAPTIYRLFGDKDGLLSAALEHVLARHIAEKAQQTESGDPVEDLRLHWDLHIGFCLANPYVFELMHATRFGPPTPAWSAGIALLRDHVRAVARIGRLRVGEDRAVDLIDAMGIGAILTALRNPPEAREALLAMIRESVFATVIDGSTPLIAAGAGSAATALRAGLDEVSVLSPGERHLLDEVLGRIAAAP